jgi:PKD repeat protein
MLMNPSGGRPALAARSTEFQGLGLLHLIVTVFLLALVLSSSASAAAPPIADFTASPLTACTTPTTVFFTDQSISADSWAWDFGDGGTSTAQNPIYSYVSPGNYQVTLTATNASGSDVATDTISISVPSASFSATRTFGCGPLETGFTDTSTSDASITSWSWDFGDGTSSTEQNPIHTYDDPGVYNVVLTITDANSCSDTQVRSSFIQVIGPKLGFSADVESGDVPLEVTFTNETLSGAPIISANWDFGDGATSSLFNPSHTYSTAGAFDVSLTVADLDGCSRALSKPSFVTTQLPIDERLANLALSAGTLNPKFSSDITSYTASVASANESITVTPTLADANATVTVNGNPVASGQPSDPIALIVGDNTITVVVQGNTTATTIVVVTRSATIGGTLSGLAAGNQVVLRNNGSEEFTLGSNGIFAFATEQLSGTGYLVEVLTNPTSPNQLCEVTSGGTGTVGTTNVTDIEVVCTTLTYTVGGSVSGLEGSGLVLQNNGGADLPVTSGASTFTFPAQADGTGYDVSVQTDPADPSQTCSVTGGNGTLSGANITNVVVTCSTDTFTVGGTVTGLEGNGLVLVNNGDELQITGNGPFTFPAQADGTNYEVTVSAQPEGQHCGVLGGVGTLDGGNVNNVTVSCLTIEIAIDLSELVFAELQPGTSETRAVTIRNSGEVVLVLEGFEPPQLPFSIDLGTCAPLPRTLAPGEQCSIKVNFDPDRAGSFSDELVINSNAASSPDRITLRGGVAAIPVPALIPLGLLVMILLSGMIGFVVLRRRAL